MRFESRVFNEQIRFSSIGGREALPGDHKAPDKFPGATGASGIKWTGFCCVPWLG